MRVILAHIHLSLHGMHAEDAAFLAPRHPCLLCSSFDSGKSRSHIPARISSHPLLLHGVELSADLRVFVLSCVDGYVSLLINSAAAPCVRESGKPEESALLRRDVKVRSSTWPSSRDG